MNISLETLIRMETLTDLLETLIKLDNEAIEEYHCAKTPTLRDNYFEEHMMYVRMCSVVSLYMYDEL